METYLCRTEGFLAWSAWSCSLPVSFCHKGHVELSFCLRHMSCALFFFVSGGIYSYGEPRRSAFCRGKVNSVSCESQQFFPGFLCAGRAWFGSVSRRRSLMRDATEEEGQPTLGVTECNGAWSEGARSRRLAATEGEEQPMPKLRRGMGD